MLVNFGMALRAQLCFSGEGQLTTNNTQINFDPNRYLVIDKIPRIFYLQHLQGPQSSCTTPLRPPFSDNVVEGVNPHAPSPHALSRLGRYYETYFRPIQGSKHETTYSSSIAKNLLYSTIQNETSSFIQDFLFFDTSPIQSHCFCDNKQSQRKFRIFLKDNKISGGARWGRGATAPRRSCEAHLSEDL